jgi:uncharacterized protein with PQ loop repeat
MIRANHHLYIRKGIDGKKFVKRPLSSFDRFTTFISSIYPLSGIPQVISVFSGSAEGVSLITWGSALFVGIVFTIYGIKHRVIPMIVTNSIWVVLDILIIIGVLISR